MAFVIIRLTSLQVWWECVDGEDRPVVIMRLKSAVDHCTDKAATEKVARAAAGQVRLTFVYASHSVVAWLKDFVSLQMDFGVCNFRTEGLVVVLDCRFITTMQVAILCSAQECSNALREMTTCVLRCACLFCL